MTAAVKKMLVAVVIAVLLLGTFVAALLLLDLLPKFRYRVVVPDEAAQSLRVEMTISVPLFSKKEEVFLFLGEKDITVRSCTDTFGNEKETFLSEEGIVTIPVTRASRTTIVYDVAVGVPGKHGNRGAITDRYAVFDGDQAFLLPAEFYVYSEEGVRNATRSLEFAFDFPDGWQAMIPFDHVENPEWHDIYAVTKNAFVFGEFEQLLAAPDGLTVYALPGQMQGDISGFTGLYAYYADLFGSLPPEFNIILLPSDGPEGQIIGGSGTATVAASFDDASARDWQLLSHRLFHAFYDNVAPYIGAHVAPNLWLIEGLSTYYENLATDGLPEEMKAWLGIDVNRQLALTYDQYLYMRFKEPYQYNFAPMDEDRITSAAMTEFLHYTSAPLIVKALEDASVKNGNPPDALLRYCLNESAFESGFTAISATLDLLGEENGAVFCDQYLLGLEIIPLWDLKAYQPPTAEILDALNYIETLLANWQQTEHAAYPADLVSMEELRAAMAAADGDSAKIPVMSDVIDAKVKDYCPALYATVKDYYHRASQSGYALDDRELRQKMTQDTIAE